ncbi:T9SS type B sorting domain-containing protein [Constantimarinum furrinae]|uniref:CARDB domain-containing protein n=1 Tax=Constantimarinum furrinae TaxID=2562285 RepID=A0A7G8PVH6_9FLAO|nr:gliding motility-associated C-terminal domain-containing protein [Constantimarinum furrinae]QNJ98342.1 hypothetical protein ALE3EI_1793 [Constantimarinum furrinae]
MNTISRTIFLIVFCLPVLGIAQDEISLFQQFNGRYDYLAFGNTLNTAENTGQTPPSPCTILTQSSADFALQPGQTLVAAYLYWAGSGAGDFNVTLNGTSITASRTFSYQLTPELVYFSAFADITDLVAATGNGGYTLTDLDLTNVIPPYCANTTNFGGWAVTVIYEEATLPLNQVNIFDGYESVSASNPSLTIELDNLNVLDNIGAKIGFLAWEGDQSLANNETLRINGNIISNPPLNPADNAFNSTNSFTGSSQLYNMDIDFYNIENNIQPGDTSATIDLTSNQDLVIINNIVTVLNTELPDATIEIDQVSGADECGDRTITVDYTVYNVNSTDELPANTPIAFYANTTLVGQSATTAIIPIGGSESGTIDLSIPAGIPADFELKAFVDDDGTGTGVVNETNEDNNSFIVNVHLLVFPVYQVVDLELCEVVGTELFDLNEGVNLQNPADELSFHLSEDDALNNEDPIPNPEAYENITNPQTIWIRLSNPDCFITDSFEIEVVICPLPDAVITIDNNLNACRQRDLTIEFTVSNIGTGPLPANTPIAFYIDGLLLGQSETQNTIPINGSEPGSVFITLPPNTPDTFTLLAIVDDTGNGSGIVEELNEFNNEFSILVEFGSIPPIPMLPDLLLCDEGMNTATFDLTVQNELISTDPDDMISYFTTLENAIANENAIADPEQYVNSIDPQTIYVRLENEICFTTASFLITTKNCPPQIPQGISPNGDGLNDVFKIKGLIDVFEDFILKIYSREGNLIYEGGNEDGLWDAIPNTGLLYKETIVPVGTYYYVLILNDPEFPEPYLGWVYVNY